MKKSVLIILFTGLLSVGFAQDTIWTPDFHMKFKSIQSTSISDDGKYVAYVVRTPVMEGEKSEYLSQIWVAATDGTFNEQYTQGEKSSYAPQFSPDGRSIAFLSSRSKKPQIFMMRLMGGEPIMITDEKNGVQNFKWAPDGKRVIFSQTDPLTEQEEKDKKEKRDVILVDKNYKYTHLYSVDVISDDHKVKRLTSGNRNIGAFDISPDGKSVVFSYQYAPTINSGFIETDIAMVPSDSGEVTELVTRKGTDSNPKFSPDGKFIAFQTSNGNPEPIGLADISLLDLQRKRISPLPLTPDRSANLIGWNKEDGKLLFGETYNTSSVAMGMDLKGGSAKIENEPVIPKKALLHDANGVGGAYSVSNNGIMTYRFESMDKPQEVFVKDLKTGELKQISHVNDGIEIEKLAKTELIKWKSKDGLDVEGLLTYPIGYEKGKKYPIILNVHGGPAGAYTQGFTGRPSIYMIQYFAEQGYAILRPNPRGSTGYGKEFRYANFMDWGFGDFDDLVTGVDEVIKRGIGDSNNQFLMGWSYGGYMTSFAVTKTDRFNAASMGAGLPNLVSMVSTTDIPDYLVGHLGDEFWNDYETYEKHSAIYQIKNVKTPTQVIHGQNDLRVPFTQGQEFYVALKRLGIDTEMIVYPRTPHGPREPKFLMDVSPRILNWFEKYKK